MQDLRKIYENRLNSLDDIVKNVSTRTRRCALLNVTRLQLGAVTLSKKSAPEMLRFDTTVEATLDNFYDYHERKSVELNARVRGAEVSAHF